MKKAEVLERIGQEVTLVEGSRYLVGRRVILLDYGWVPRRSWFGKYRSAGWKRPDAKGVAVAVEYDYSDEHVWLPAVVQLRQLLDVRYADWAAERAAELAAEREAYRLQREEEKAREAALQAANHELRPLLAAVLGRDVLPSWDSGSGIRLDADDRRKLAKVLSHYEFITAVRD